MWCTHGITQARRGEGPRDAKLRYTGCEANFIVRVVKIVERGITKWQVCADENTETLIYPPQQTRNVLRQVLGSSTLERTKTILDTFAEENAGNGVLLVQDQLDITCVIAMQTSIQKACFEQWGDTLVMDWTHGTNNLVYHLVVFAFTLPGTGYILVRPTLRQDIDYPKIEVNPDAKIAWRGVCQPSSQPTARGSGKQGKEYTPPRQPQAKVDIDLRV
ncbi:unnamed protein product [Phytophthora fragariaefolia]|uniref:Unnamed protein product n=1 Tax=Phytophthora fragariaefolia TaxID=1490495 RepID=A0A9W6TMM7_9STRA|nr:unnamed protein product [Phytophthora fragariaefolia]